MNPQQVIITTSPITSTYKTGDKLPESESKISVKITTKPVTSVTVTGKVRFHLTLKGLNRSSIYKSNEVNPLLFRFLQLFDECESDGEYDKTDGCDYPGFTVAFLKQAALERSMYIDTLGKEYHQVSINIEHLFEEAIEQGYVEMITNCQTNN
jgi:hypothetical protein